MCMQGELKRINEEIVSYEYVHEAPLLYSPGGIKWNHETLNHGSQLPGRTLTLFGLLIKTERISFFFAINKVYRNMWLMQ
jgi:hypothetical protein